MSKGANSFWASVWKKLKKNSSFWFASSIVFFAIFIAFFAYLIVPDNTPNADLQCVEIMAKPIGFSQQFLKIKKNKVATESIEWLNGAPSEFTFIPINSYQIIKNELLVQKRIDDDTTVLMQFNLDSTSNYNKDLKSIIVTKKYWLGTDKFGRDLLSRLIIGTRISLLVGVIAVFISLLVGLFMGSVAGYYGKITDSTVMWLVNVIWSVPTMLLVFALTLILGRGFFQVFIAIGLTTWVSLARLVRGQVLSIKELDYIQAAKAMGYSNARIIIKHILPNILGPVIVIAASNFATAIILEAGLSFLGFGVQPPQPSWGLMIKENYNFIITNKPLLALIPGFAIMLFVLAINILGNALRDAMDVKS